MERYGGRVWARGAAIPGAAWARMGGLPRWTIIDLWAEHQLMLQNAIAKLENSDVPEE